jgi:hypothetical protein
VVSPNSHMAIKNSHVVISLVLTYEIMLPLTLFG